MITAVLIASGFSKRMGQEKLLLPIFGVPMIQRIAMKLQQSKAGERILVYRNQEVRKVTGDYVHQAVMNEKAALGQSEAVKLGVKKANPQSSGYLFVLGDQPLISVEVINQLIETHQKHPYRILRPVYADQPGNPVLFPSDFREQLLQLEGDEGGRVIIQANRQAVLECSFDCREAGLDADTWETYRQLTKKLES